MRLSKKIVGISMALIVAALLAASVAPYWLYQNQEAILKTILDQVNDSQVGHVEIGKSKISPFKQFPYISLEIDSIYFYGDQNERKDTIYFIQELYVGFNAWKILQGQFQIKEVTVEGGFIDLITDSTGQINLMSAKSAKKPNYSDTSSLSLDIKKLHIRDFRLDKTNLQLDHHFDFQIKKADFKLRYQPDLIEGWLEASLEIGDANVDNAHFLQNKDLDLHFHVFYDVATGMVSFKESAIDLDQIQMSFEGTVDTKQDLLLDLDIDGKKDDFGLLLAFAPDEIQSLASHYENAGEIYFHAKIKGPSAAKMPRVDLEFGCKNAWIVHSKRQKKVEDIAFQGFFSLGDSASFETAELSIRDFNAKPGNGRFTASLIKVKNFVRPQVSLNTHADLDMASIRELLDTEELPEMSGQVVLDVVLDELIDLDDIDAVSSKIQKGADSHLDFKDFSLKMTGLPFELKDLNGSVSLREGDLVFEGFSMKVNDSDLAIEGSISRILDYLHGESAPMVVSLAAQSKLLNLESLMAAAGDTTPIHDVVEDLSFAVHFETTTQDLSDFKYLPLGAFYVDSFSCRLRAFPHRLHDFHADIRVDQHQVSIQEFRGKIDQTDFLLMGKVDGWDYLDRADTLAAFKVYVNLVGDHFHLDDVFTYQGVNHLPKAYQHEHVKDFEVIARLSTTNRELQKESGLPDLSLEVEDIHATLSLHHSRFRAIHGKFSTKDGNLKVTDFEGQLGKSDFHIDAEINGLMETLEDQSYRLALRSQYLDWDQLLDYQIPSEPVSHDSVDNIFATPFPSLTAKVDIGEMVYHKFYFKKLHAALRTTPDHYCYIDTAKAEGADGAFGIKGYFNGSDTTKIYLSSDLYLDQIDIDKLFFKFDNFGQDYMVSENVHGRLSAQIKSKVRLHPDFTPYLEETNAHIEAEITDGSIIDYAPLQAMADYFADKNLNEVRFGKMSNTFDIENGTLYIPRMSISSTLGYLDIKGEQSMSGNMDMDYVIRVPLKMVRKAMMSRTLKKNRGDDQEDDVIMDDPGKGLRLFIRVHGTAQDFEVKLVSKKEIREQDQ